MLVVESARAADIDPVARLAHDALRERYNEQWLAAHTMGNGTFLVARDVQRNRVVGFAVAEQQEVEGHILAVAVEAAERGRGIGRALLGQVRQQMQCSGALRLHLEVRADDPRTQAYYRRLGFAPEGIQSDVYSDGSDALVMARPL